MNDQKIKWPNGNRCALVITLDFDGECTALKNADKSDYLYRSKSYGEYAPRRAMPRLLDMLERLDLPGTFFTPARNAINYPELVKTIDEAGHEIGNHGFEHELFTEFTPDEQRDILLRSQDVFDKLIQKVPTSYRTPAGEMDNHLLRILVEEGFICSACMWSDDIPKRVFLDGKPTDLIEIHGKWALNDHPAYYYCFSPKEASYKQTRISSYSDVFDNLRLEFEGAYRYGTMFTLTLHPKVIGRPGRIMLLEGLLKYAKSFPGVWFTTASNVARWYLEKY